MTDDKKAKAYLKGNPLRVVYYLFPDPNKYKEYEKLFEIEYPDYIPNEEEKVAIKGTYYTVLNKVYEIEDNKITISITPKSEYDDMIFPKKKAYSLFKKT